LPRIPFVPGAATIGIDDNRLLIHTRLLIISFQSLASDHLPDVANRLLVPARLVVVVTVRLSSYWPAQMLIATPPASFHVAAHSVSKDKKSGRIASSFSHQAGGH